MNILYIIYWLTAALPHGYRAEAFNDLIKVTHDGTTKVAYLAQDSDDNGTLHMAVLDESDNGNVTTVAEGIRLEFWSPRDPTGEHVAGEITQCI